MPPNKKTYSNSKSCNRKLVLRFCKTNIFLTCYSIQIPTTGRKCHTIKGQTEQLVIWLLLHFPRNRNNFYLLQYSLWPNQDKIPCNTTFSNCNLVLRFCRSLHLWKGKWFLGLMSSEKHPLKDVKKRCNLCSFSLAPTSAPSTLGTMSPEKGFGLISTYFLKHALRPHIIWKFMQPTRNVFEFHGFYY